MIPVLNLVSKVISLFSLVFGIYYWWLGDTHEMAGFLLMTIILNNELKKD
jgi:hypothetical protein